MLMGFLPNNYNWGAPSCTSVCGAGGCWAPWALGADGEMQPETLIERTGDRTGYLTTGLSEKS